MFRNQVLIERSVPDVLENAMKTLKIGEGLDFDSQHVPWEQLRQIKEGTSSTGVTPQVPGGTGIGQGLEDNLTRMGHPPHDLAEMAKVPFRFEHRGSKPTWFHPLPPSKSVSQVPQVGSPPLNGDTDERPAKRQMFDGIGSDFLAGLGKQDLTHFDPFAPTSEPLRQAQAASWTSGQGQVFDEKTMELDGFDQNFLGEWLNLHSPKADAAQLEDQIPSSIEELLQSFQRASESL